MEMEGGEYGRKGGGVFRVRCENCLMGVWDS